MGGKTFGIDTARFILARTFVRIASNGLFPVTRQVRFGVQKSSILRKVKHAIRSFSKPNVFKSIS